MSHYDKISTSIKYLIDHYKEHPSLHQLAELAGMSESHFQRLFTAWVGLSPKQFASYLTVEELKGAILSADSIEEAAQEVGLSSPSRAYDLMINIESVTPGQYKNRGVGMQVYYGTADSPFGSIVVASTKRGIIAIEFLIDSVEAFISGLKSSWRNAEWIREDSIAVEVSNQIFTHKGGCLTLLLKGTPFQIKVWQALLKIPEGKLSSYAELAQSIGNRGAVRAVASAVARNPISVVIPCHRIIRSEGIIGQYHWGSDRKAALLVWERHKQSPKKD